MDIRFAGFALAACFTLAACGDTGDDLATTDAPPSASQGARTDPQVQPAGAPADQVGTPAATQAYQQDTAEPADQMSSSTTAANDALARCATLDTAQRDACEMQARQGLDPQQQGVMDPNPASPTPPTDQVPADATAQDQDGSDGQ